MEPHDQQPDDRAPRTPGPAETDWFESVERRIARAVRVVAELEGVETAAAAERLWAVSLQAGVSMGETARRVLLFHTGEGHPTE